MSPHYGYVARRASHRCEYCHAPEAIFNLAFEIEHIIPLSEQGVDAEMNLALACRSCNLHKGKRIDFVDEVTAATVRLFNPRLDNWDDHFRLVKETGLMESSTAIGRATLDCLRMNSPLQRAARIQWIRAGLLLAGAYSENSF